MAPDIGLHQQLQDALGYSTQKVTVAGLLQKLIQWQSVLGHRGLSGQCEVEQLHPRRPAAVTTPAPLPDRHVFPPPIPPQITPPPWTLPARQTRRSWAPLWDGYSDCFVKLHSKASVGPCPLSVAMRRAGIVAVGSSP